MAVKQRSVFERIKVAVNEQKEKKVRADTRKASLTEEQQRIFAKIKELTGKDLKTMDELEEYIGNLSFEINEDVQKMQKILDDEGVEY